MSDLRKAADMALVAIMDGDVKDKAAAVYALRQALAQPEREQYVTRVVAMHEDGTYITERIPLPKREWVGLTDEEIWDLGADNKIDVTWAHEIEAKLKEKNT